ncbi:MAG: amidophosphoribosyltransferase [Acidimicrobiales bacterium]
MKEACGVFGVYAPGARVAQLTFDGLFALQHRGQESAGIAVSDGDVITVFKDMGLVAAVFDERSLSSLQGDLAIGHTRYSTTGPSTWQSAQPVFRSVGRAGFALGHNGNLTNTEALATSAGMLGALTSDSDLVAELLARRFPPEGLLTDGPAEAEAGLDLVQRDKEGYLQRALEEVLPDIEGAFSFSLIDVDHLIAVRDPHGFRPLCLGRLDYEVEDEARTGWIVASESPALDVCGAHFVREIEPGEMVVIDGSGPRSFWPFGEAGDSRLCVFEFVYFARPDSRLRNQEVYAVRRRMGELLAAQHPVEADMVIGVPDSGVTAAEGYAAVSKVPYGQGLVKNRYIGRTFIAPTQEARALGVRRKLNPLRASIAGKRLVVVDDSIVRGTTTRQIVKMLRETGAAEVHLRISSPPFQWPCYYGIDTPSRNELIASRMSVEQIRDHLGADSLDFLSLDNLMAAVGADAEGQGYCRACLTGQYPTEVPVRFEPTDGHGPEVERPSPTGSRELAVIRR